MRSFVVASCAVAAVLAMSGGAHAQDHTVVVHPTVRDYPQAELGVQAGAPSGLSGKYWFSPWSGVQAGVTWRFPKDGYSVSLDYVTHSWSLRNSAREPAGVRVPLYAGAGVKALRLSSDHPVMGARFPLGIDALFDAVPVSVFAEVAPGAVFEREGPKFSADAGIGARVYF